MKIPFGYASAGLLLWLEADMKDYDEDTICPECGGKGYIITCCDDICVGSDHCIHGDGEDVCEECEGEGVLRNFPEEGE